MRVEPGAGTQADADARVLALARAAMELAEVHGLSAAVVDPDRRVLAASELTLQSLGVTAASFVGGRIDATLQTESADRLGPVLAAVLADGERRHVLLTATPPGRDPYRIRASVTPLHDGDEVVGLLLTREELLDDLSGEVASLERELHHYVMLASLSGEPMWRCEQVPVFHYSWLNRAAEEVLDVTLGELVDDPDLAVRRTHPDDRAALLAGRRDPGRVAWPLSMRWADRTGRYRRLEVREVAIADAAGTVVASLGIARDLSTIEREATSLRDALHREQRATERLRAVDDLRQTFLRAVSHELRTPLAGVLGYAETLQVHRRELSDERIDQLVGRLVHNAARLRDLLDDLLDIDRLARGTLVADRHPADVAAVVLRALELVGARLGQVRVDVHPVVAEVDEAKVERIVDNLVHNAIKHAGPNATVWVRLRSLDGHAELVVEDDGPGIDPELRERIFEPFEQGRDAAGRPSPGTGLGLTLVSEFVRLHDGTVEVADRPGGGARFVIRLPREAAST